MRIAGVVITYNRMGLLAETLRSLQAQTRRLDELIVVDNGSTDGTAEMLALKFPDVHHLRLTDNTGPAGGMAAGLTAAGGRAHDWVWLFGDDDLARPEALETLLTGLSVVASRRIGMLVGWMTNEHGEPMTSGAQWRHRSVAMPTEGEGGSPHRVDHVCMSGALVSVAMVADIGVPHAPFFIMFEEIEYCLRANRAGWEIYVLPTVVTTALHAGSARAVSAWRGYYQTRNHLAFALRRRSPVEVTWWIARQMKIFLFIVVRGDRKLQRLHLRLLGAWHALRRIDGRTIEPPSRSSTEAVDVDR